MKRDGRGNVIELQKKIIPHDEKGDPAFTDLGIDGLIFRDADGEEIDAWVGFPSTTPQSILEQFTPEEVVYMVNRYIYTQEYQRTVHRERTRRERDALAPIKAKVMELYGISWSKATDEQLTAAANAVAREATAKE